MSQGTGIRAAICVVRTLALWPLTCTPLVAPAQTAVEAWVQRYSHAVGSSDVSQGVVTDNDGNVIVTGYTDDGITGADFLTIKYSGAGVPLWTNRYNGRGNKFDQASAVALDGNGNVFVTGSSVRDGSTRYATLAYSSSGAPLWTNLYQGENKPTAIAVDASGGVFVAGQSWSGSSYDYATVAYSGAGVPLWTNSYNGSNGTTRSAYAYAMTVNGNGTVFVTGSAYVTSTSHRDYVTVAYSGAGVPLWTNRYNGNLDDQATLIAGNGSGGVVVTGISGNDFATIAYSASGVPLWTNRYDGPNSNEDQPYAVAVDASGNVFVAGWSNDGRSLDFATVAYSGAGVPLWTNRYKGPFDGNDRTRGIAVDSNGTVLVTGYLETTNVAPYNYDWVTLAYSGYGQPLWTNYFNGPGNDSDVASAVAVDINGAVIVTGFSVGSDGSADCMTVAYSAGGVPLWTNRFNGAGNNSDYAAAVAVSASNKVYVTGYSSSGAQEADYATVAYSDTGVPLWTNRYNGPSNGGDHARALAVDPNDNVFVAGGSPSMFSNRDFATVAYSGAGVPLWTNRYNGPASQGDEARAVIVDRGRVFVTGYSMGADLNSDYATVAYSLQGVPLWTNRYNGNLDDLANAMAVDDQGNVVVTGQSANGSLFNFDYATVAYSGMGVPLWTNRYNGPKNDVDQALAVAADRSGNVFVTGISYGTNSAADYATVAYSGSGMPLWTNRYNGLGNSFDFAVAMAVDGSGNVFVTGQSEGPGSVSDYATVAYSGTGVPLWTNLYNGPGNGNDWARAVAVDGNGNVTVTGLSVGSGSSADYATIAYSGAGAPLWTNRYNGPANGEDRPETSSCLAIGPDGAVHVTGSSNGNYYSPALIYDYATVKYTNSGPWPIRLNHQIVDTQLVLSWTNAAFRLLSAPTVQGDYTDVPGATSPYVTSFSGAQRFYRLKAD